MNAMPLPAIDPQPILNLIQQNGGECTFSEAIATFKNLGMSESAATDALWRVLSDGTIEFTTDRNLTVPAPRLRVAAG